MIWVLKTKERNISTRKTGKTQRNNISKKCIRTKLWNLRARRASTEWEKWVVMSRVNCKIRISI